MRVPPNIAIFDVEGRPIELGSQNHESHHNIFDHRLPRREQLSAMKSIYETNTRKETVAAPQAANDA
ncbi:MAG: hypothetical protein P4L80_10240 [Xanthobacteraceae bacterium]|nr:hypothetical protein [Xanthobacteraceae bacterium]